MKTNTIIMLVCVPVASAFLLTVATIGAALVLRSWEKPLPVYCSFRKEFFGNGEVARVHNKSMTPRKVEIYIRNPSTNQIFHRYLFLGPRDFSEIGWLQGWRFVSGEIIDIHQSGFRDVIAEVP